MPFQPVGDRGSGRVRRARRPSGDSVPKLASPRVRRNRWLWAVGLLALIALLVVAIGGGHGSGRAAPPPRTPKPARAAAPGAGAHRLDPDWTGDGKPVTFAFGGDVHFPVSTTLGDRLAADPATALGPTVPELMAGANLTMTNFESALTDGTCPDTQSKQYVFYAPSTAITAFQHAGITLITEANNHGEDCGPAGLQMALQARQQSGYPIVGIGQNVSQAFTPYRTTINGQKIAIFGATQVIDADLQTLWTATSSQPGLASAYDVDALVAAVQAVRRTRRHRDRLPALGDRAAGLSEPVAGAAGPTAGQGGRRHHRGHPRPRTLGWWATWARPTSTTDWATSPSTTTRPPRTPAGAW